MKEISIIQAEIGFERSVGLQLGPLVGLETGNIGRIALQSGLRFSLSGVDLDFLRDLCLLYVRVKYDSGLVALGLCFLNILALDFRLFDS